MKKFLYDFRKESKSGSRDDCAEIHIQKDRYILITLQGCYLGESTLLTDIKKLAAKYQISVLREIVYVNEK